MKNLTNNLHPVVNDALKTLIPPHPPKLVKSTEELDVDLESKLNPETPKGNKIQFVLDEEYNEIILEAGNDSYAIPEELAAQLIDDLSSLLSQKERNIEKAEDEERKDRIHKEVQELKDRGFSNSAIVNIMHG